MALRERTKRRSRLCSPSIAAAWSAISIRRVSGHSCWYSRVTSLGFSDEMVFFPSSTQSRISATEGFYGAAGTGLFLRALGRLLAQRSRRLDQLLDRRLILAAGLQQVDA